MTARSLTLGRTVGASCLLALLLAGCSGSSADDPVADNASATSSASTSPSSTESGEPGEDDPTSTPDSPVEDLVQVGIEQAQGGDLATAASTFTNVLALDATNKFALYNLGLIAQTNGDNAGAQSYYDQTLVVDPSYTPALYNKAISLEGTDVKQAIAIYQKILVLDPEASTTYLRLSYAYEARDQPIRANKARKQAVALDPALAEVTAAPTP